MKTLIFLALLVSLSYEESLLGAKECTYGPGFWCSNLRNANKCRAVSHCIQTIWEQQTLPEDNDDICQVCVEMVKEARDQLNSNETVEEIKEVFEGSCKLIPIDVIRDECIQLSDEFIEQLIETLSSEMNPQVVCATAGLCNSGRVDRLIKMFMQKHNLKTLIKRPKLSDNCVDCSSFVRDVVTDVKRHSKNELLNALRAICGRLSTLSEGCMLLVEQNLVAIYDFLTHLHPKDVCQLFGMCEQIYGENYVVPFKRNGDDESCDFCEAIVTNWRNNLISNTTKGEFKMILDGICHQTGKFEKECLSLVNEYFDILYDFLVSEVQPREICEAVGLCGPNSIFNVKVPIWTTLGRPGRIAPMMKLRPAILKEPTLDVSRDQLIGLDEANSYNRDLPQNLVKIKLTKAVKIEPAGLSGFIPKKELKANSECEMCEFTLHFLQNLLNEHHTQEEIEKEVEKVCTLIPKSFSEACQDYIEAYGAQIIQLIIQNIDPSQLCPALGLCPKTLTLLPLDASEKPTCILCELVMTKLDEILKDKHNEDEIKKDVLKVCDLLPKSVRGECKTFVTVYIDDIINLLVNDYTPQQVCAQLGLCEKHELYLASLDPSSAQLPLSRMFVATYNQFGDAHNRVGPLQLQNSPLCIMCEWIIQQIDYILFDNATMTDVLNIVETICLIMPKNVQSDCKLFIDTFGHSIIDLINHKVGPHFVCSRIYVCASVDGPSERMQRSLVGADPCTRGPSYWCASPENIAECNAEVYCNTDGQEEQVEQTEAPALLGANECTWGPSHWCSSPDVMQACNVTQEYCTEFLAKASRKKRQSSGSNAELVGSDKCSWGPSYWCASVENAQECNATEYCVSKGLLSQ